VTASTCDTCRRPAPACVCDRIVPYPTRLRVLILQHPQEQDAVLGTAQLLVASLPKAELVVGLSWPNLAGALRQPGVDPRRWAVLFPDRDAEGDGVLARNGSVVAPSTLEGLIVLDGTWAKAKTLWWRNPWLAKLNRLTLTPSQPSIYGRLRVEPRRDFVSTLESVAGALTLSGEPPEIEAGLLRVFRTLVQRVRDGRLVPSASRKRRPPRGGGARRPKARGFA
jgi:DTW domain-containing protein YfiP